VKGKNKHKFQEQNHKHAESIGDEQRLKKKEREKVSGYGSSTTRMPERAVMFRPKRSPERPSVRWTPGKNMERLPHSRDQK